MSLALALTIHNKQQSEKTYEVFKKDCVEGAYLSPEVYLRTALEVSAILLRQWQYALSWDTFEQTPIDTDVDEVPILDVGSGTGQVGARLGSLDFKQTMAVDLSVEMLTEADAKVWYTQLICGDLCQTEGLVRS